MPHRAMTDEEVKAFRRNMQTPAMPRHSFANETPADEALEERTPESRSDFSALSETQYGKL